MEIPCAWLALFVDRSAFSLLGSPVPHIHKYKKRLGRRILKKLLLLFLVAKDHPDFGAFPEFKPAIGRSTDLNLVSVHL